MIVKFGFEDIVEDEIYTEEGHCERCCKDRTFEMKNNGFRLLLLKLVPIISCAGTHVLQCPGCYNTRKISRKEYREKLSRRLLEIESRMSLTEYEASVCQPKNLKIFGRIIKVIVTGWIASSFSSGYFDMLVNRMELDAEGIIFGVIAGAITLAVYIPFAMSINGLYIALKKRSLYKKIMKHNKKLMKSKEQ